MENQPTTRTDHGLVARAKGILLKPSAEWPVIAAEKDDVMAVFLRYAVPLAAIGPVASFIGMQLFGMPVLFGTVRVGMGTALTTAITSYVLSLVALFVFAWIANFISPKFGGKSDWPAAFKLAAYSITAAWVAAIFGLIPPLSLIGTLLSLYTIYLFYKGATPMLAVPAEKSAGFTAVSIIVTIVAYLVVGVIAAAITGAGSMATGAFGSAAASSSTETASVNLGGLGSIEVDGSNQTIDMGAMGRMEIDEESGQARMTINGQEIVVDIPEDQQ